MYAVRKSNAFNGVFIVTHVHTFIQLAATAASTATMVMATAKAAGLKVQWMQLLFSLNGKHFNRN